MSQKAGNPWSELAEAVRGCGIKRRTIEGGLSVGGMTVDGTIDCITIIHSCRQGWKAADCVLVKKASVANGMPCRARVGAVRDPSSGGVPVLAVAQELHDGVLSGAAVRRGSAVYLWLRMQLPMQCTSFRHAHWPALLTFFRVALGQGDDHD